MRYVISDIIITRGDTDLLIPGRSFDSSTAHDVAQYIDTEVRKLLADTELETATRVNQEQIDKLTDPVQAPGIDPPADES